ncbi:type II secretion system protein [Candidatus Nitrospira salsa]
MKPECSEISLKNFQREASFVKREAKEKKCEASCVKCEAQDQKQKTRNIFFPTRYASRKTLHASPFPFVLPRSTLHTSRFTSAGFTLIEMLGVLAILAILGGLIAPKFIQGFNRDMREAEMRNLQAIAQGVEVSLRENRAWPANLAALTPAYVPFSSAQISQNERGFPRYYAIHPNTSGFTNGAGLAASNLDDVRFLLISNLTEDANPTINTVAQFDAWWNTDETSTPDLKIYRGTLGHLFHLVAMSAVGTGGSYQVDGNTTNSGGGTLAMYNRYHLVGTPAGLDEANNYNTPEVQWTLTSDAGYLFDPNCTSGNQWQVLGTACTM